MLTIETPTQLQGTTLTVSLVSVVGVDLLVEEETKVLGVVLDHHLTFKSHITAVARVCNYHTQAVRHIWHLLTTELALMLACSLILSRLDYCNAVFCGAPASSFQKLQHVQTLQHESFCRHRDGLMLSHY